MPIDELHAQELAKVAPEGHRNLRGEKGEAYMVVYCPWKAADAVLELNHRGWWTCQHCLRPVDTEKLERSREMKSLIIDAIRGIAKAQWLCLKCGSKDVPFIRQHFTANGRVVTCHCHYCDGNVVAQRCN